MNIRYFLWSLESAAASLVIDVVKQWGEARLFDVVRLDVSCTIGYVIYF